MERLKLLLLVPLLSFCAQAASATNDAEQETFHDFTWQGIKYRVIDEEAKTCMTKPRILTTGGGYDYTPFTDGALIIPEYVNDGDTEYKVTEIGTSSFQQVSNIQYVSLPSSIVSIGEYAFYGSDVSDIDLPDGLQSIKERAFGYSQLQNISIPSSCLDIENHAFEECTKLNQVSLPLTLEVIQHSMFWGCTSLKSISIPENVKSVRSSAFHDCKSLVSVNLPSSLSVIESDLFFGCDSLTHIDLPENVTKIGNSAFYFCKSLTDIRIPDSVKHIGESAFAKCPSLSHVHLPSSLETIDAGAFYKCALEEIEFPKSLKRIEDAVDYGMGGDYRMDGTFAYNKFKEVIIPDNVEYVGKFAFDHCKELEYVKLPAGLTEIADYTFNYCSNLKEVVLPISLDNNGGAFNGCHALHTVVVPDGAKCINEAINLAHFKVLRIPASLDTIDVQSMVSTIEEVYYNTSTPRDICNPKEAEDSNARIFSDNTYQYGVLYVGVGGLEAARRTYPWKKFVDIREMEFSGVEGMPVDMAPQHPTEIYDIQGHKVHGAEADLPSGLYIVREGNQVRKILR